MKKGLWFVFILCSIISAQEIGARYLIITHDNFYDAIQPLAQWKHRKGMRTKVVKISEIGSSTSQIRSYIQNAYNTWQIRPDYLLFVGAPNYIPFYYYGGGWNSYYSDNYYTNMDSDVQNEILSGRLTVHTTSEAQTVVNKILLYEKTPDLTDSLWFINACLIANEDNNTYPPPPYGDDSIYWSDVHHAKGLMLANGYHTIDTLSRLLGNNASTVIARVNLGRAFVLYRGSGTNNWYTPFAVEPNQLQNGTKLPIVLSCTCGTIGTGSTSAAAERWLLTGTPTVPRGASGYFATTTSGSNIAHLRSAVAKGFFNAVFQQHVRTFGEACEGGRQNVYNLYSSTSEYQGFTTIGDPEMNIWTTVPKPLDVTYNSQLNVGDDSLVVRVNFQEEPLESALVCALFDTLVYECGYTAGDGRIIFALSDLDLGYLQLTVTGRNKIPYLDSIPIISTNIEEGTQPTMTDRVNITVQPNPFSKLTTVSFGIAHPDRIENISYGTGSAERIELKIYDASGRIVREFRPTLYALRSSQVWDGTDNAGHKLPAGVYFVQAVTSEGKQTIPVLLVR